MARFKPQEIVDLELPSSTPQDPVNVTIDLTVTGGMAEDMYGGGDTSRVLSGILAGAIQRWNFLDENDRPVPITTENVRRLDPQDFTFLAEKIANKLEVTVSAQAVSSAEKKAS